MTQELSERIDALLPQTQCTRCGYPGCRPYAEAMAEGVAINRCPPGGAPTIAALAALLGRERLPLDASCGSEADAGVAWIDAQACIGCARCLPPCPVDAIIGAPRYLHTVQASRCTGCELCLASCPVDCIQMRPREAASAAPSSEHNRRRFEQHRQRARLRDVQRAALLRERKHVEHDVAAEEPAGTPAAAMTPQRCRRIFEALRAANPEPRSELQYRSPFELLIAVMLSAQATDRSVNLATAELFRIASTSQAMLELGLAGLKRHIRTIGLYNTKARNIVATCKLLVQQHDGQVPHAREALEALPGVGRKTANVVLNVAFGEPTLAVDTHVFRVANRTGLARAATPREVEDELLRVIPREFLPHAHHWLILHGRYVCKARRPECPRCPIARWCGYEHKTPP